MRLTEIDKNTYRSHLNVTIVVAIAVFATLGVGISTLLIKFFGAEQGNNFLLNLLGVATAGVIAGWCLQKLKNTAYFYEIAYVWDLKHELNLITRRLTQLQQAADQNDIDAIIVLLYNYHGSRQLWQLDDNVLNLQELELELFQLDDKIRRLGLNLQPAQYQRDLLHKF